MPINDDIVNLLYLHLFAAVRLANSNDNVEFYFIVGNLPRSLERVRKTSQTYFAAVYLFGRTAKNSTRFVNKRTNQLMPSQTSFELFGNH